MKEIILTKNKIALVDDEDYEFLSQWKWHVKYSASGNKYYAGRCDKNHRVIYMHRVLKKTKSSMVCDHINGDTLDNRRDNLRNCSYRQNSQNRTRKGVHFETSRKKWVAQTRDQEGKKVFMGRADTMQEAVEIYNNNIYKYQGEYGQKSSIV